MSAAVGGAPARSAQRVRAAVRWAALLVWNLPRDLLVGFIRLWRLLVSPLYGPTCKYHPSCSAYGLEAVRTHGAVRGSALTIWRILRCNPWSDGGIDDVPPATSRRFARASADPSPRPLDHDHTPRRAA